MEEGSIAHAAGLSKYYKLGGLEMTTKNWKDIVALVTEDIRCHRENGVSLNPYSTDLARAAWQNGFEGKDVTLFDWGDCYQRGVVAAQLMKEVPAELYHSGSVPL